MRRKGWPASSARAVGGQIRGIHPPLTAREALYDFMEPNRPPTAALREAKETTKLKYKRSGAGDAGLIYEQVLCAGIFINVFSIASRPFMVIWPFLWIFSNCHRVIWPTPSSMSSSTNMTSTYRLSFATLKKRSNQF